MAYSTNHWFNADNYPTEWSNRSQLDANLLRSIDKFNPFELETGLHFPLKLALADSGVVFNHFPCDLNRWDSKTMVIDLNKSDDLKLFKSNVQKITSKISVISL